MIIKTCETCARARRRGNMVYCRFLGIDISKDHADCKYHDYGIRRETWDNELHDWETETGSAKDMVG